MYTEYPQPPYPSQKQPMPGSTGKMNPRPDHGEESYKGSGKLKGMKAIITGDDSGIGRAVADHGRGDRRQTADIGLPLEGCSCDAVIARSFATKQSTLSLPPHGLLRGACHRARIRATRWLAMTGK